MSKPDDLRFEWVNVGTWDNPDQWIRGACNHLTPVPVRSGGELVAYLCPDCDQQLAAGADGPSAIV